MLSPNPEVLPSTLTPTMESISKEDVDIVRDTLFGSAKMKIYGQRGLSGGASQTEDRIVTVRPDDDVVRRVIIGMHARYVQEFGRGVIDFAKMPEGIRHHHATRETNILKSMLYGQQRALTVGADGQPSIRFGMSPPTRIEVLETTTIPPTDEDVV